MLQLSQIGIVAIMMVGSHYHRRLEALYESRHPGLAQYHPDPEHLRRVQTVLDRWPGHPVSDRADRCQYDLKRTDPGLCRVCGSGHHLFCSGYLPAHRREP